MLNFEAKFANFEAAAKNCAPTHVASSVHSPVPTYVIATADTRTHVITNSILISYDVQTVRRGEECESVVFS